jgi:hypothetical protein
MELQKKIANAKNMDYDAAKAIKELLEQGPREVKKDLMDWEVKEFKGETYCSTREKIMCQFNCPKIPRSSKSRTSRGTPNI